MALLLDSFVCFYNAHRINTVVPWFCAWWPSTLKSLLNNSFGYSVFIFLLFMHFENSPSQQTKQWHKPSWSVLLFNIGLWCQLWLGEQLKTGHDFLQWHFPTQWKRVKHVQYFLQNCSWSNFSLLLYYQVKRELKDSRIQVSHQYCSLPTEKLKLSFFFFLIVNTILCCPRSSLWIVLLNMKTLLPSL